MTIALVGDPENACAGSARDGVVTRLFPVERWRRVRTAGIVTAADVRDAIAQVSGADSATVRTVVATPDLADVTPAGTVLVSRLEAAMAMARLYAPGPCLLLFDDTHTDTIGLWHVTPTSGTCLRTLSTQAGRAIGTFCRAHGLDHLPASQVEALARTGLPDDATTRPAPPPTPLATVMAPTRAHANALAHLQHQLADAMTAAVRAADVDTALPLVLSGRIFRNSFFSTALASATTRETIVPSDPGNGGLCVGLLAAVGAISAVPSPFAGPAFDLSTTKQVLDNCKLSYQYPTDTETRRLVVDTLRRGRLVAWFAGGMEWGPRALGHRSILADARSPFVLENLNVFLKKRPSFMSYGLSVLADHASSLLQTPRPSPHMQFESPLADPALAHFVSRPAQAVRFHTVPPDQSLAAILTAFRAATGVPYLVNTSFNATTEPIVATPLDAVRCFYGSGIDLLVVNGLVLTK